MVRHIEVAEADAVQKSDLGALPSGRGECFLCDFTGGQARDLWHEMVARTTVLKRWQRRIRWEVKPRK